MDLTSTPITPSELHGLLAASEEECSSRHTLPIPVVEKSIQSAYQPTAPPTMASPVRAVRPPTVESPSPAKNKCVDLLDFFFA